MKRQVVRLGELFPAAIILGVFLSGACCAQNAANTDFSAANTFYKDNRYDEAIGNYKKILDLGLEGGNLYYNIGNAYFKKGEFGKAVVNYERARLFIPNDSDLRSNYDYALAVLNLGPQYFPGNWFLRRIDKISEGININLLTIILSLLYTAILAILFLKIFPGSSRRNYNYLLFIAVILFITGAVAINRKIEYLRQGACVISKEADVKFEPRKSATTYFTLSEGSKVEILESSLNWSKIKRSDNLIGWVSKEALELICAAQIP